MVAVSAVVPFALVGIAIRAAIFGLYMLTCGFFLVPGDIELLEVGLLRLLPATRLRRLCTMTLRA